MGELLYVLTKTFLACVPARFLFFSLTLIFTLVAVSISHFLSSDMKFPLFSSNEIRRLCLKSLAVAPSLLST